MKKYTKKLIALLCGVTMTVSLLTGCGQDGNSSETSQTDNQTQEAPEVDNESNIPAESSSSSDVV